MKHLLNILLIGIFCSACAPINTEFSCNKTATDTCLSIEEVNAMTKIKGDVNA